MKEDIQNLSDNGWSELDDATKQRLKQQYPKDILQAISDSGWSNISDETKNIVRSKFESPSEMRDRAKGEYLSDVATERQKSKEDFAKTHPIQSYLFPKTIESQIQNKPYSSQVMSSVKDVFSIPGRVFSDVGRLDNLIGNVEKEYPKLAGIPKLAKDVVEDPLLPLSFGLGSTMAVGGKVIPAASRFLTSPVIQGIAQGVLNTASEWSTDNDPISHGLSFAVGAVPDIVLGSTGKYLGKAKKIFEAGEELRQGTSEKIAGEKLVQNIFDEQTRQGIDALGGAHMIETPEDLSIAQEIGRRQTPEPDILIERENSAKDLIQSGEDKIKRSSEKLSELRSSNKNTSFEKGAIGALVGHSLGGIPGGIGGAIAGYVSPKIIAGVEKIVETTTPKIGKIVSKPISQNIGSVLTDESIKALGRRALADLSSGKRSRQDVMSYTRALESLRQNPKDVQAQQIVQDYMNR